MTEKDIRDAYIKIRQADQTIPDAVLDFMKETAIEKLKAIEAANKAVETLGKFVVRHYDGFDHAWMDVTGPLTKDEATKVWNDKTENGTKNKEYNDIDYYAIFPADTQMIFTYDNQDGER